MPDPEENASIDDVCDPENVVIAVMGVTGAGKSSFVNAASGGNFPVGTGLMSCTSSIQISPKFYVGGRSVVLIDTPGFDDPVKSNAGIFHRISNFLAEMYRKKKSLAGVIYLHRISDVKMSGSSKRSLEIFQKLCGETSLKNVIIATTMWSMVPTDKGIDREEQLETNTDLGFEPVLQLARGGKMVRYHNNGESARSILSLMVENVPSPLHIQIEVVDQHKILAETAAGLVVSGEVAALVKQRKQDVEEVKKEMEEVDLEIRGAAAARVERLKKELADAMEDDRKLRDGKEPPVESPARSTLVGKMWEQFNTISKRLRLVKLPWQKVKRGPEIETIPLEPLRMTLIGSTGTGKTTFLNAASGAALSVGHGYAGFDSATRSEVEICLFRRAPQGL